MLRHTPKYPGPCSLYSRALIKISGVCGWWEKHVSCSTWVCLGCAHKPHPPYFQARCRLDFRWVSCLLSSHLGWLSESHNGQWGCGREWSLNFFLSLPLSLFTSDISSVLIVKCQVVSVGTWKPLSPAYLLVSASTVPLLCGVHLASSKGLLILFWSPDQLNPGPKYLLKCMKNALK